MNEAETVDALTELVSWLADERHWGSTRMSSRTDWTNQVLSRMNDLGLVRCEEHPLGGRITIINGKLFGRTDGIVLTDKGTITYPSRNTVQT